MILALRSYVNVNLVILAYLAFSFRINLALLCTNLATLIVNKRLTSSTRNFLFDLFLRFLRLSINFMIERILIINH